MEKSQSNFHFVFLGIVFAIGIIAISLLVTTQTSSSVLTPTEVVDRIEKPGNRYGSLYRVRVAGRVSEDPVEYQVDPEFRLEFTVVDRPEKGETTVAPGGRSLKVLFEDVKPDMFASGRDVLIDGNVIDGVLHASALLTQCPSKYEPEEAPHEMPASNS